MGLYGPITTLWNGGADQLKFLADQLKLHGCVHFTKETCVCGFKMSKKWSFGPIRNDTRPIVAAGRPHMHGRGLGAKPWVHTPNKLPPPIPYPPRPPPPSPALTIGRGWCDIHPTPHHKAWTQGGGELSGEAGTPCAHSQRKYWWPRGSPPPTSTPLQLSFK